MPVKCEVCEEPVKEETDLYGCDKCGRLFGPCCNSDDGNLCGDCFQ